MNERRAGSMASILGARWWGGALLGLVLAPAIAAPPPPAPPPPVTPEQFLVPPPPPPPVQSGEPLEPEVTIRYGAEQTVTEYRLHGRLFMVKVTPRRGYSYFLIDADGDGELETRRGPLSPGFLIPAWVLFSW